MVCPLHWILVGRDENPMREEPSDQEMTETSLEGREEAAGDSPAARGTDDYGVGAFGCEKDKGGAGGRGNGGGGAAAGCLGYQLTEDASAWAGENAGGGSPPSLRTGSKKHCKRIINLHWMLIALKYFTPFPIHLCSLLEKQSRLPHSILFYIQALFH